MSEQAVAELPPEGPAQVTLRELLRDRTYRLYLIGQTASSAGSALSSVALVFAVLSISASPGSLGLVLLAGRIPGAALTLTAGVAADRWSRRWVAAGADATRAVLQTVAAVLMLCGRATVAELALLQAAAGAAGALSAPAAGALLTDAAPRRQTRRAASLLAGMTAGAQLGALTLTGVIVALAGPGTALAIDAATFACSALTLVLMRLPGAAHARVERPRPSLRGGFGVVWERPWLRVYALHETLVNVLVLSPFFVLGPVIARLRLGGAAAWSGIALGYLAGSLAAAAIAYHWAPRRPVLAAMAVSAALLPLLLGLGSGAPLWVVLAAAPLAGAQATIYNTLITATMQANLPGETLGRATVLVSLGSKLLVPAGMGLAGLLAGIIGPEPVLLGAGGVMLSVTAICVALPPARAFSPNCANSRDDALQTAAVLS